jgi:hypothetical protein
MKIATMTFLAATGMMAITSAATVTWDNGGVDSNWFTGGNWSTDAVPNINGTDNATISNGDAVTYNAGADFDPGSGSTVTVSNGSSVTQTVTNWQRSSGGTLTLDNGSWTTASVVRNAYDNGVNAGTFNLLNGSSYIADNEFWVARPDTDYTNVLFDLNISGGSSADFNGGVGLWLWDADAAGNDYNINFSGAGGSIEGRIGYQTSGGSNNSVTWETLWNDGILQWDGANAGVFSDHFSTTGTAGTTGYRLEAVPEPSSTALLGLGGVALLLRRRR